MLDQRDAGSYIRSFLRTTQGKGRIWGLHNYEDVNRHRATGLKQRAECRARARSG